MWPLNNSKQDIKRKKAFEKHVFFCRKLIVSENKTKSGSSVTLETAKGLLEERYQGPMQKTEVIIYRMIMLQSHIHTESRRRCAVSRSAPYFTTQ